MSTKIIKSLAEFQNVVQNFSQHFFKQEINLNKKQIFFLQGNLGAGKTTFVQNFIQAIDLNQQVTSPTFALHNSYELQVNNDKYQIDHWDLYRLQSEDELESSGFWDQLSREQFLLFIEWPSRLQMDWIHENIQKWKVTIDKADAVRSLSIEKL